MTADELSDRLKQFTLAIIHFSRSLSDAPAARETGKQLLRAALSVSANYSAARRSRSRSEFIAKLGVVLEEADEAEHWLGIMRDAALAHGREFDRLKDEASQLRAILFQSLATARRNHARQKRRLPRM